MRYVEHSAPDDDHANLQDRVFGLDSSEARVAAWIENAPTPEELREGGT
jgi:hypothetical protein